MKQLLYIALLLISYQAGAFTSCDSTGIPAKKSINGGSIKKQMGNRVYMKTNSPKVFAIKCLKNPNVICAYVASVAEEEGGDPYLCPANSSTFVPDPYYSMQFPNPQKTYVGIPKAQGGVKYYELNSATFDCSSAGGDNGHVLINLDPPVEIEGE